MPLLMVDLDNTLIDRDAAFRTATSAFLAEHGLPETELDWVTSVDDSGYVPRAEVAARLHARWNDAVDHDQIVAFLARGAADFVILAPEVEAAVRKAHESGWRAVVVTNGRAEQQRAKLCTTGLDQVVSGWVISQQVGHAKPSREIFEAAAATVRESFEGAWMIGDAPRADIGGAVGLGVASIWLARGREWPGELPYAPTHVADSLPAAIEVLS